MVREPKVILEQRSCIADMGVKGQNEHVTRQNLGRDFALSRVQSSHVFWLMIPLHVIC